MTITKMTLIIMTFSINTQTTLIQRYNKNATCGLYYKRMMIVNDNSRVVTKLETSLTDDARVVIYDCHMFIVQAKHMLRS
jgi:hypothetical protein